jgi:hypothetical protein
MSKVKQKAVALKEMGQCAGHIKWTKQFSKQSLHCSEPLQPPDGS